MVMRCAVAALALSVVYAQECVDLKNSDGSVTSLSLSLSVSHSITLLSFASLVTFVGK
jgi:hypothetical protein